ncbi:hypothetical protein MAELSTROM_13 [Pseudoalteromonas phage Maelstrom]|uniref:hypothetical protein n=1 Tax=Pseudoalteromonas phage Maelstrom TaxID=2065202 RepID=UPI000CA3B45D|nr:hypothetical protein PP584_gp13 [Pseudoalteromonas phage Maelstrom]AUG84933.1 hypothetical protein MAELSTROM_13 [Pseudoalteromonas phage Maelstrom]
MRDLTPEELKLTPEWAESYAVDNHNDALFFSKDKDRFQLADGTSSLSVGDYRYVKRLASKSREIEKPFDITKYEFSDADIKDAKITVESNYLHFKIRPTNLSELIINKQDAIAIAKALGVTGGI